MSEKIAFIGLGKMGSAMVTRLLESGYDVHVYNRTPEKALPLVELGAYQAESIAEAIHSADILMTSLLHDEAVMQVSQQVLQHARPGLIHVNTATILPETARRLNELHEQHGCYYLASPFLGVPETILQKKATIFCSGHLKSAERVQPILSCLGAQVVPLGPRVEDANIHKICMNYVLVSSIGVFAEVYAFAEKSGLDTEVIQAGLHHIYGHPGYKRYIDKIHDRDFDQVNFDMHGGNKDITLFIEAFQQAGVAPDVAGAIQDKFAEALQKGLQDKDWSAVADVVRARSGL